MKNFIFLSASILLFSCQRKQPGETTYTSIDSMTVTASKKDSGIAEVPIKIDSPKIEIEKTVKMNTETSEKEIKTPEKNKESKVSDGIKKVIINPGHEISEAKGKTYRIKSYSIDGDVLSVDIIYRGGCGKHNFELYSNGLLKKSLPPQIDVHLEHQKENETCAEEIKQTLRFDISSLKKPGNAVIVININNADHKVEWKIQ